MNSKKTSLTLGMAVALTLGIAIMFASPLSATTNMGGGMMMSPSSSYSSPQQPGGMSDQSGIMEPGLYASGTIASLQNDKDGKPAWIVSGLWRGSLTNLTSDSAMMSSSSSANNATANKTNLPTATFNAVFNMVMLDGSAMHRHQISNFTLTS